jgi:hypothetical protein
VEAVHLLGVDGGLALAGLPQVLRLDLDDLLVGPVNPVDP